jgi:hypothetical protein
MLRLLMRMEIETPSEKAFRLYCAAMERAFKNNTAGDVEPILLMISDEENYR